MQLRKRKQKEPDTTESYERELRKAPPAPIETRSVSRKRSQSIGKPSRILTDLPDEMLFLIIKHAVHVTKYPKTNIKIFLVLLGVNKRFRSLLLTVPDLWNDFRWIQYSSKCQPTTFKISEILPVSEMSHSVRLNGFQNVKISAGQGFGPEEFVDLLLSLPGIRVLKLACYGRSLRKCSDVIGALRVVKLKLRSSRKLRSSNCSIIASKLCLEQLKSDECNLLPDSQEELDELNELLCSISRSPDAVKLDIKICGDCGQRFEEVDQDDDYFSNSCNLCRNTFPFDCRRCIEANSVHCQCDNISCCHRRICMNCFPTNGCSNCGGWESWRCLEGSSEFYETCDTCNKTLCPDCSKSTHTFFCRCDKCDSIKCSDHIDGSYCSHCFVYYCYECMDDKLEFCEECREMYCFEKSHWRSRSHPDLTCIDGHKCEPKTDSSQ